MFEGNFFGEESTYTSPSYSSYRTEDKEPEETKENKKRKRKIPVIPVLFAVILLVTFVFNTCTYTVNQNEYAYVTRLSKMVAAHNTTGLNFKAPFIDKVAKIPAYQMIYDIPPSEVITKDKKTMVIDNFAIWSVSDPQIFVQTVRGNIAEMESRISASVYSAVKNEFGRLLREEIVSTDPSSVERVAVRVTEQVSKEMAAYGVDITSVEIKKTDLPDDNAESVYNRMIAERNQIAAAYIAEGELEATRIRNEVDQNVAIIVAEAEAKAEKRTGEAEAAYMEIMSSAYNNPEKAEFYKFLRELDALKVSFKDGGSTLILDQDSAIVNALLGK